MKIPYIITIVFFSVVVLKADSNAKSPFNFAEIYSKYFRGITMYGLVNKEVQTFDAGAVLRWDNVLLIHSVHFRTDSVYTGYGFNSTLQRLFPTKIYLTPYFQAIASTFYFQPKIKTEFKHGFISHIGLLLSLGLGSYIELNKYFQIGGSINYELTAHEGRKIYFDLLPLVHLKYEFQFTDL